MYDPGSGKVSFAGAAKLNEYTTLKRSSEEHMDDGSHNSKLELVESGEWEHHDLELSSDEDEPTLDAPDQSGILNSGPELDAHCARQHDKHIR